jgi:hypothetical protein
MKVIKNILVGFLVSFLGSIPLGYLNIIGFQIYTEFGIENLVLYLLGVVFVEAFVIYFTLIFANRLVNNVKLMRVIDVFAIFFLLFLAYSFYSYSNQTAASPNYLKKYVIYSPFLIGLLLSSINFLQLPFWTGWNVYLINGNYIKTTKALKFYYVGGTLAGTFAGMMGFVFFLHTIAQSGAHISKYLFAIIIPLFFIVLACLQGYKVFKKYNIKP